MTRCPRIGQLVELSRYGKQHYRTMKHPRGVVMSTWKEAPSLHPRGGSLPFGMIRVARFGLNSVTTFPVACWTICTRLP